MIQTGFICICANKAYLLNPPSAFRNDICCGPVKKNAHALVVPTALLSGNLQDYKSKLSHLLVSKGIFGIDMQMAVSTKLLHIREQVHVARLARRPCQQGQA